MKLSEMSPRTAERNGQRALMRLQLRFTAETHRLFAEFEEWLLGQVAGYEVEGEIDGGRLLQGWPHIEVRWRALIERWRQMLDEARVQAVSIPFGVLLVRHNQFFRDAANLQERWVGPREMGTVLALWERRRMDALLAGAEHIYSDGFQLSGRIWRLEHGGLNEIRSTLMSSLGERTSAARLAQLVEPMLGAGQDCPRWAWSRLYGQTPAERAADSKGLLRGDECRGQGLSYKALRLARNEIQIAHHGMVDEIFERSPWVEGEEIMLSPQHPVPDVCDEYAEGGPYEPGEVPLPLHVQCMCWKAAVLMGRAEFTRRVRGWVRGENGFLDEYAEWSGLREPVGLDWQMPIAQALRIWLEMSADGHAEALGL